MIVFYNIMHIVIVIILISTLDKIRVLQRVEERRCIKEVCAANNHEWKVETYNKEPYTSCKHCGKSA